MEINERPAAVLRVTEGIAAVARAHWRVVKGAMESETGVNEKRMKQPTRAEIIKTREDVMEYLLDGGMGSPGADFADGVRQALGWVLGMTPCPDYREDNGALPANRG